MLTVLFKLETPLNAEMIMIMILQMCSLEFIPTGDILDYIKEFRETKSFAIELNSEGEEVSKFAEAGYDSSNYWQLLGALFFIVLAFGVFTLCKLLCKRAFKSCKDNYLTRRLRRPNKYGVVLMRFLLEACLEIGLSAMISVIMMSKETFKDFWEVVAIITAFVSIVVLAVAPYYFKIIQKRFLKSVESGVDKKACEHHELFVDYRSNRDSLMYPIIFLLRRYEMIFVLTTMPGFKYA